MEEELQPLLIEGCAESGTLLVGGEQRFYLSARYEDRKPARIAGKIVTEENSMLASFATNELGCARVQLPSSTSKALSIVLDTPLPGRVDIALPRMENHGWTLRSLDDCTAFGAPVRLSVRSARRECRGRVALAKKDVEVASLPVHITAGEVCEVQLTPARELGGVLRAVLYDEDEQCCAERLLYRFASPETSAESLWDSLLSDLDVPLLEETRWLEQGSYAWIDLLLGVQDWRRFAFTNPFAFARAYPTRALSVLGGACPNTEVTIEFSIDALLVEMETRLLEAKKQVAGAIAEAKRIEQTLAEQRAMAEEWERKIAMAERAGESLLAQEAQRRKEEHDEAVQELEAVQAPYMASLATLKEELRTLALKVEQAKRRKLVLLARRRGAIAEQSLRSVLEFVRADRLWKLFEELEQTVGATKEAR